MKKEKLTPEDKAEVRRERKAWNEMIHRMKNKGALIDEQETCNDPSHKQINFNLEGDCPRCLTCGKKVML